MFMAGVFMLDIPRFVVSYSDKSKDYGYSDPVKKENMLSVLKEASSDFCMYCYRKTSNDGDNLGQIEHAIEKCNSDYLVECMPNLGLACPKCNQSYKRRGEKKRKLRKTIIGNFETTCECGEGTKKCFQPCDSFITLKEKYTNRKGGHIILQPLGVELRKGIPLIIQYDVLSAKFRPATTLYSYNKEELEFIEDHINQFCLNDSTRKTRELFNYVKDVVDYHKCLSWERYSNYIVKLFVEELNKYENEEDRIKICEKIYLTLFSKM